jgi:hypothetical protein
MLMFQDAEEKLKKQQSKERLAAMAAKFASP